jgi:hypothetical protein
VAVDDYFEIPYETTTTFYLCVNDLDAEGDPIGAGLLADLVGGSIVGANGQLCYFEFAPDPGFSGVASFTYVAMDRWDATVQSVTRGTVTIVVADPPAQPANTLPVAADDIATTPVDTLLTLLHADLTTNDVDADGDALKITALGVVGDVLPGEDWHSDPTGIRYQPPTGFVGTRTLSISVSDGTGSVTSLLAVEIGATDEAEDPAPASPAPAAPPAPAGQPAPPAAAAPGMPAADEATAAAGEPTAPAVEPRPAPQGALAATGVETTATVAGGLVLVLCGAVVAAAAARSRRFVGR